MTMTIELKCKAFGAEGAKLNRIMVDEDGTIRVWDRVAGHYTTCHSLSASAVRRVRRIANK